MNAIHPTTPVDDQSTGCLDPSVDTRDIVAVAWPTGRPIYSYTVDELAQGVDLYTRAMKARTPAGVNRGDPGEK